MRNNVVNLRKIALIRSLYRGLNEESALKRIQQFSSAHVLFHKTIHNLLFSYKSSVSLTRLLLNNSI